MKKQLNYYQLYYAKYKEMGGHILGERNGNNYKVLKTITIPNYAKNPRNHYELPNFFQVITNKKCLVSWYKILRDILKSWDKKEKKFKIVILGDWHSHICKKLIPSGEDIITSQKTANITNKLYVLGICSRDLKSGKMIFNFYDYKPTKVNKYLPKDYKKRLQENEKQ
ncbi:MAG: hypothetical protein WC358_00135 [Ignavibacteria bacterium]|jgi:hypothetical protein